MLPHGRLPLDELPLKRGIRFVLPIPLADLTTEGPLELTVNVAVGRRRRPRVVAVAGVHGNEGEGPAALADAWGRLPLGALDGTLVAVLVANPPAFLAGRRTSPMDDADLNRVFPGRLDGSPSERLAHRLFHDVVADADFLLSMHSWYEKALVVPYVEVPSAGPTAGVARAAAGILGLRYVEPFSWHPGLLVAVANAAGIPAVEPEIGGLGITLPERSGLYQRVLEHLLGHLGLLPAGRDSPPEVTLVERAALIAPASGILRPTISLEAPVRAGDPIARILDLGGRQVAMLSSPTDGVVAALRLAASVSEGDLVAVIFRPLEEPSRADATSHPRQATE